MSAAQTVACAASLPTTGRLDGLMIPRAGRVSGSLVLDSRETDFYPPAAFAPLCSSSPAMRIRNSLRSAKTRDKNCRVVRRRGRVYVINKVKPRMKVRQG